MYTVNGYIVCMLVACHLCDLVFGVGDTVSLFTFYVYGLVFGLYGNRDYDIHIILPIIFPYIVVCTLVFP